MTEQSFGAILRDARERKGYDLPTTARRLRIRPDILQAIEQADFARMPPRGYARNMVNAYARFVGLNPTEITRQYLDETHMYLQMKAQAEFTGDYGGFDMGAAKGHGTYQGEKRAFGARTSYSERECANDEFDKTSGMNARSARERRGATRGMGQNNARSTSTGRDLGGRRLGRGSAAQSQYTNYYAGPAAPNPLREKAPYLIGAAIVLIFIIVVCVLVFGGNKQTRQDTPMPISGLSDTSNPVDTTTTTTTTQTPVQVAPEKETFAYSVADGASAYIEVYEGDSSAPSVAETVSGPAQKNFDVTTTLKFVTTNPSSVSLTLDGQALSESDLTEVSGVYSYTVDFPAYLQAWNEANAAAAATTTDTSAAAGTSATTSASAAATTTTQ